jgi:RNA polymerase sigma factor (sigma-70 family)
MGNRVLISNDAALDFAAGLYETNEAELRAYLRRRLPSTYDAADACQQVFLRMCSVNRPSRIENPRAYLFRTAHNVVQDHFRKRRVTEVPLEEVEAEGNLLSQRPSLERELYAKEWWDAYCTSLDELSPRCRRVFVMCRVENTSHAEIAAEFGISIKMVEKYMTRALAHLALQLAGFLKDDFD